MDRKLRMTVAIPGVGHFGPGQEKAFYDAVSDEQLEHLEGQEGVFQEAEDEDEANAGRAKSHPNAGAEPLPAVRDLAAALDQVEDEKTVKAMQRRDKRPSAKPIYKARLDAMKDAAKA